MEVTSFGAEDWKETRTAIEARQKKGEFQGEGLQHQWWVLFPTGTRVRQLERPLTELLARLEEQGLTRATSRYDGEDRGLQEIATALAEQGISSVDVWQETPPRACGASSFRTPRAGIGTAGALPAAIAALFEKSDNQEKLAKAECNERHLYAISKTTDLVQSWRASGLFRRTPPTCWCNRRALGVVAFGVGRSLQRRAGHLGLASIQLRRRHAPSVSLGCASRPAPPGAVTAQGHPRAIFKRAIGRGNLVIAEATARGGGLTLEEAPSSCSSTPRTTRSSSSGLRCAGSPGTPPRARPSRC